MNWTDVKCIKKCIYLREGTPNHFTSLLRQDYEFVQLVWRVEFTQLLFTKCVDEESTHFLRVDPIGMRLATCGQQQHCQPAATLPATLPAAIDVSFRFGAFLMKAGVLQLRKRRWTTKSPSFRSVERRRSWKTRANCANPDWRRPRRRPASRIRPQEDEVWFSAILFP